MTRYSAHAKTAMRRSTGKRRRSSRIAPTRRNPSYAPSRPSHRGPAKRLARDCHTTDSVLPRGGAPYGQLCSADSLFDGLLGKRRTEFPVPAKLPESSRVVLIGRIRHQVALPSPAARLTKVEASRGHEMLATRRELKRGRRCQHRPRVCHSGRLRELSLADWQKYFIGDFSNWENGNQPTAFRQFFADDKPHENWLAAFPDCRTIDLSH